MKRKKRKPRAMYDHERVARYVERFFAEAKQTEWPTVRRVARAFGWKQSRVEDACEGDPDGALFLSAYFMTPEPTLGDHFVERAP